ncbi:MAG: DUF4352 domain-containing protein (plasmid) [Candidatus Methanoperedens sp.]|nr:MAG: DUF4352 domain-containing protein [Candidatus Methanoperedens sp.]
MSIIVKLGKAGIPGFRSGKKWKMAIAIPIYLFLVLFLLAFISVIISGPPQQSSHAPDVKSTTQATVPTPIPTKSIEEIKSTAINVSYDDLFRNNDKYIGKIVYYRGKIVQVYKNPNNPQQNTFRISTAEDGYNNIIWVLYEGQNNYLEDDAVDIWGEVSGLETYKAVLGNEVTIPKIKIFVLERPSQSIVITYSAKKSTTIGMYSEAPQGKIFLIITMTVDNKGYNKINTNPNNFKLLANNIKYDYATESYSLTGKLDSIDLLNGGTINGSLAFEVPSDLENYQLQYEASFRKYNVIYNKV